MKFRSVMSELKAKFGKDNKQDRKRILNMFIYHIINQLLLRHPGQIMTNARDVKMFINEYLFANIKHSLPRPPRVETLLACREPPDVISLMRRWSS